MHKLSWLSTLALPSPCASCYPSDILFRHKSRLQTKLNSRQSPLLPFLSTLTYRTQYPERCLSNTIHWCIFNLTYWWHPNLIHHYPFLVPDQSSPLSSSALSLPVTHNCSYVNVLYFIRQAAVLNDKPCVHALSRTCSLSVGKMLRFLLWWYF